LKPLVNPHGILIYKLFAPVPQSVPEFYKYLPAKFKNTRKFTYEIISIFGSTYRCEQLFSVMKGNKTTAKNSINDTHFGSVLKIIT
jgi:hypothetical protein